jgi:hypothetical protein
MTIRQSPATDCETLHRDAHEKDRMRSLLVELVDRVAALEAAAAAPAPPVPAPPAPAGGLVEFVMNAAGLEQHESRASIRAVAAWLETRANAKPDWPKAIALAVSAASLREEADR